MLSFHSSQIFAGVVGEQVFTREAQVNGKFLRALGDEHDVAGVFKDLARDQTDVLDIAHAADGAGAARGSMHAAGVKFDDAFFVGKSAEADAVVAGVVLAADADVVRRLERVGAVEEHLVGLLDRLVAGDAGNDDRFRRRLHLLDLFGCRRERRGW